MPLTMEGLLRIIAEALHEAQHRAEPKLLESPTDSPQSIYSIIQLGAQNYHEAVMQRKELASHEAYVYHVAAYAIGTVIREIRRQVGMVIQDRLGILLAEQSGALPAAMLGMVDAFGLPPHGDEEAQMPTEAELESFMASVVHHADSVAEIASLAGIMAALGINQELRQMLETLTMPEIDLHRLQP